MIVYEDASKHFRVEGFRAKAQLEARIYVPSMRFTWISDPLSTLARRLRNNWRGSERALLRSVCSADKAVRLYRQQGDARVIMFVSARYVN